MHCIKNAHLSLHNIRWVRCIVQRCVWTKRQKLAPLFVYCDRLGLLAVTGEQQHFAQSVCRNKLKISPCILQLLPAQFEAVLPRFSIATACASIFVRIVSDHWNRRCSADLRPFPFRSAI
ncbi:hypothetical protein niasHS_009103 [Heterodera schachtii]|uniref:Uncharacterized protein n=1 Tax=Heterodera schachtii TaxID=97005 RepID=A0ABD2J7H6_HETSC